MAAPVGSLLWRSLRVYQVFGANTEVGKTVFSTILAKTSSETLLEKTTYVKPVSTGSLEDADDQCSLGKYAIRIPGQARSITNLQLIGNQSPPSDIDLLGQVHNHLSSCATRSQGRGWLFLETAGGVHSPAPSGTTQADLYIPLRLPVILVGDSKLGGISQTICAFESLKLRGYNVEAVVLFRDSQYQNYGHLTEYFQGRYDIPVWTIKEPPRRKENKSSDEKQMLMYYAEGSCSTVARNILDRLKNRHEERVSRLESMAEAAHDVIWYPFTQQKLVPPESITVIDSARGDFFQTMAPQQTGVASSPTESLLKPSFDGSASWWTQGLGHANPQLSLAAACAAGRYGHVIFASTVHEPALALAETLLKRSQNPRLARVFYSDNGSTGTEVAVKMGLRAARVRYGWEPSENIGVLGLKGGYHGDTIGAMDCSEPCVFNEKVEWYRGKGFWFDYPTVLRTGESWVVGMSGDLERHGGTAQTFDTLDEIFDMAKREERGECKLYERYIIETLEELQAEGRKFGALILEPIVLGAGGMAFVDPLFQRTLVKTIRRSAYLFRTKLPLASEDDAHDREDNWTGLPIIFDEVFTGLYRLGRFTASSLLGTHPDISVHAKLLTGGLVPLCATLASDSIFRSFESEDKSDALLHGHSYTAHPVGCQVALESLRQMTTMEKNGDFPWNRGGWEEGAAQQGHGGKPGRTVAHSPTKVRSMWSRDFVESVARQTDRVAGVWALGSILAIHMRSADRVGYKSTAAAELQAVLLRGKEVSGGGSWNVHSRVLGNVFYIMGSLTTRQDDVERLESLVRRGLGL